MQSTTGSFIFTPDVDEDVQPNYIAFPVCVQEVTMAPVEIPPPQPEPIMAAAEKENEKESQEEAVVQAETVVPPTPSSFAPIGFVFQAPAGLPALQSVVMPPSSDSALPAPR